MIAAALGTLMKSEQGDLQKNEALKLLQRQKWVTPISSILPDDFVLQDQQATSLVTIEDALSHRTGVSGADLLYGNWMGVNPKGIVKALSLLGPPNKPFRTTWQYNNLMYSTAGDVLATATGLDWGAALRKTLWQPLGMSSTFWHRDEIPEHKMKDLARGYYWVPSSAESSEGIYLAEKYLDFAGIAPAGSVVSNVMDYAKWMRALLAAANKSSEDGSVITPELFADLTTPRILHPLPPIMNKNSHLTPRTYSLGWFNMSSTAGLKHPIVAHAGGLIGFGAQLFLLPNDDFGIVVLANTALTSNFVGQAVCNELMARKLGIQGSAKEEFLVGLSDLEAMEKMLVMADAAGEEADGRDGPAASNNETQPADTSTQDICGELQGKYRHPAYGVFSVSISEPQAHDQQVVYGLQVLGRDRRELDKRRSSSKTLEIQLSGLRTWPNHIVLHQRKKSPQGQNKDGIFFDLELLATHGQAEQRHLEASAAKTVLESTKFCRMGAAFKQSDETNWSLGLRLANEYIGVAGREDNDWESEMAWFEKENQ